MSSIRYTKTMNLSFHKKMMEKAIALGEQSRQIAPPNPWVGCVIVNEGLIVGQGATQKVGEKHAEIIALEEAGAKAKAASAYVTLEPCSHFGRTPPCVDALIQSQIAKVFIALTDPDPKVNGKGIQKLKSAGIEVQLGICEKEAAKSLKPYLYQRKTKLPYIVAKCACSLDGRIAAQDGTSKWISSEKARQEVQKLRAFSQGILIGSKTAFFDLPKLTVREGQFKPLRIVLDSQGILDAKGPLFDISLAETLIITTDSAIPEKVKAWQNRGVMVEKVSKNEFGKANLEEALHVIASKGVIQLLCEGGGDLFGALLSGKYINRFLFYFGPCLLGEKGKPLVSGVDIKTLTEAVGLKLIDAKEIDGTLRVDYEVVDADLISPFS